jgi:two-component system OmpR family response regulator
VTHTAPPKILYVEDEAIVAMVVEMALEEVGYRVAPHIVGASALKALARNPSEYAALVTDVRLPDLDGWYIARRARELSPGLPIVYVTGDSAVDGPSLRVPGSIVIQKPFPNEKLIQVLDRLVGR